MPTLIRNLSRDPGRGDRAILLTKRVSRPRRSPPGIPAMGVARIFWRSYAFLGRAFPLQTRGCPLAFTVSASPLAKSSLGVSRTIPANALRQRALQVGGANRKPMGLRMTRRTGHPRVTLDQRQFKSTEPKAVCHLPLNPQSSSPPRVQHPPKGFTQPLDLQRPPFLGDQPHNRPSPRRCATLSTTKKASSTTLR